MRWFAMLIGLIACTGAYAATEVETLLAAGQRGDAKAILALRAKVAHGKSAESEELGRLTEALKAASLAGDAQAQNNYAFLFEKGIGVPRDYHQAERWYLRSAEQGLPAAEYRLGRLYHDGLVTGKDRKRGFIWLAIAAENGQADAARWRDAAARTLAPDDLEKAKKEAVALLIKIRKTPQ